MSRHPDFVPQGVIPAVLLPFHEDLSIDEPSFRAHLRDVGVGAGTVCDHDQRALHRGRLVHARTSSAASWRSRARKSAARLPIIHGVWADGSLEAARIARRAQAGGASALLVFPPAPFTLGPVGRDGAGPFQDHRGCDRSAADRVSIPAGHGAGLSGGDAGAAVRRSADHPRHQGLDAAGAAARGQIRALQGRKRPINVLSTNSAWLLSSLVLGCNGLLSGSGSVIADLQAQALSRRARPTISRKPAGSTTGSIRWRGCSTPIPSSTCTTA